MGKPELSMYETWRINSQQSFLSYTSYLSKETEDVNSGMVRTYCANTEKTQSKIVLLTSDGVGVRLLSDVKEIIHQGE